MRNWGHTAKFCSPGRVDELGQSLGEPEREENTGGVNEFGLGGLHLGGDLDALDGGWHTVTRKGKTVRPLCMGYVCEVDKPGCNYARCGNHSRCNYPARGELDKGNYERIKVTADSGAVEHAAPRSLAKGAHSGDEGV